ncbi:MAG TPA: hypothetical protein VML96_02035 [Egibacteraceae bacterium]|nr:hypothetical protein [Egibacteraceae bacterium]
MTDEARQRLNVRTIRTTLAAARQHAPPEELRVCVARAHALLEHARQKATGALVISDIDALEAELRPVNGAAH